MTHFTAINLIKVGNFLKAMGFAEVPLRGSISLESSDYLYLKQKLVELELRKPQEDFEYLDNVPIGWFPNEENSHEHPKN